ncbi:MAG: hypothetical protein ABJV04_00545 [Aliiglaciecola sp.]|uniref:hypothetical protein n=1 Tax=Aliiglaciecola sp. TaxID=1872441 RepID=UPI00329A24C5
MNIFEKLEAPEVKVLNPRDWTLEDCKEKLRVQFRNLKNKPDHVSVSIRLGGVTQLKIGKNEKMSIHVLKKEANAELFLKEAKKQDAIIEDARQRYIDSLNIARTTRNTTQSKTRSKSKDPALVVNNISTN